MSTLKKHLQVDRYESPELTVVELHLEGAVLQTSNWPTTGGGGINDLIDNGDEL